MPIVILARHGRTAANAEGILAGRSPGISLDDVGVQQAHAAGERLIGVPLAAAWTSPLDRCRETARQLTRHGEVKVRVDRRLNECDYGEWTGQPLKTLVKEPLWKVVQTQPSAARFPGGESLPEMSHRAAHAIRSLDREVADAHGDDAVWLAVSHGDVIKSVLADALGMHLDAFQRIVVEPASLSVIHYTSTRPYVLATNTTSGALTHLAPTRRRRGVPRADAVVGGGAGPERA